MLISEHLTQKLAEAEEKNLMTANERMAYVIDQLIHEYALRLRLEVQLYQTQLWARAWKQAAKIYRFRYRAFVAVSHQFDDELNEARAWSQLWKQAAKEWRRAALEAQDSQPTNGVVRIPVVGILSDKTRPADFARWGREANS